MPASMANNRAIKSSASHAAGEFVAACALIPCAFPGFIADEDVGLGDVVTRMSYAVGIRPCGGCAQRAARLNRWLSSVGC